MTKTATATKPKGETIQALALSRICPGNNDRQTFDPVSLQELADNMGTYGLAQPITVRSLGQKPPRFEIVAGERRYRAASLLGWETIPALVRTLTDEEAAGIMLAENLHRADLNPIEEARGYQRRMQQFGWTLPDVARASTVPQGRIRSRLQLLELADDVQELIRTGNLPLSYADQMTGLDSNRQIQAVRYFSNARRPTVAEYKILCGRLLAEQMQDHLFDMSTFMVEQDGIAARLEKEKAGRPFALPFDPRMPTMQKCGSVGLSLETYYTDLMARQDEYCTQAALIVAAVYRGLCENNLARSPRSLERILS